MHNRKRPWISINACARVAVLGGDFVIARTRGVCQFPQKPVQSSCLFAATARAIELPDIVIDIILLCLIFYSTAKPGSVL